MKKNTVILFFLIIGLLLSTSNAFALDLNLSIGTRDGYAEYTINDNTESWQSLLEFPLDYTFKQVEIKRPSFIGFIDSYQLTYISNIETESSNDFKDTDWLGNTGTESPDIYGEANSEVDMQEIDFNILFDFLIIENKRIPLQAGIGYKQTDHNFMIVGPGFQESNDTNYPSVEFEEGQELLEYDLEIESFYVMLYAGGDRFETGFKYYPSVQYEDLDHHILRDKFSKTEGEGTGFEFNLRYNKSLGENLHLNASFVYEEISGDGTQYQWIIDDDFEAYVNQELDYSHKSFMLGATFTF